MKCLATTVCRPVARPFMFGEINTHEKENRCQNFIATNAPTRNGDGDLRLTMVRSSRLMAHRATTTTPIVKRWRTKLLSTEGSRTRSEPKIPTSRILYRSRESLMLNSLDLWVDSNALRPRQAGALPRVPRSAPHGSPLALLESSVHLVVERCL